MTNNNTQEIRNLLIQTHWIKTKIGDFDLSKTDTTNLFRFVSKDKDLSIRDHKDMSISNKAFYISLHLSNVKIH